MLTLSYWLFAMIELYMYYTNINAPYDDLNKLNAQLGYFIGVMMLLSALSIVLSYWFML